MSIRRRAMAVFAAGALGVVALVPTAMTLMAGALRRAGEQVPSSPVLAVIAVTQPLLLLGLASVVGAALAPRVGLRSRLAEWAGGGGDAWTAFGRDLRLGIALGVAAAAVIAVIDILTFEPASGAPAASVLAPRDLMAVAVGVLYGGITEEVLMRWGLMSALAWIAYRMSGHRDLRRTFPMWVAIVATSVVFGIGHLPAMAAGGVPLTSGTVMRIVMLNAVGGLFFGWLFWRRCLEAAMAAHAVVHVTWALASTIAA